MTGQLESTYQPATQISGKVLNASAENTLTGPSTCTMEGLDCSTSESLQAHAKQPEDIKIHESIGRPSSGQEHDARCDGSSLQTFLNNKFKDQNRLSSETSLEREGSLMPLLKLRNKHNGESSGENGLDVSNETSGEAYPSFQFFVRADEGINIFVDLNSSPSDWVKKLKCEVCIYQNPQKSSWSISSGVKESGNVEEHLRISYPNDMQQSKDVSTASRQNELSVMDEYMMSSLKQSFGLDCNSAVSSNGICDKSPATTLACDHKSKEQAKCLVKGNQKVSSLEMTCSDLKHGSCVCLDGSVKKRDLVSSVGNDCCSSLPDGFAVADLNQTNDATDIVKVDIQDSLEHLAIEADHIDSRTKLLRSPCNLPCGICDKRKSIIETTVSNVSEGINNASLKSSKKSDRKESISPSNNLSICRSLENYVSRDAAQILTDEPGTVTPLLREDAFELPGNKSVQLSTKKRLLNSDMPEESLRKKRRADAGRLKDPVPKIRSIKSPTRERSPDSSGQPRRSIRRATK